MRVCPACGSAANHQVGGTIPASETPIAGKIFNAPAYSVLECESCDLYFKSAVLSDAELADYYARVDEWANGTFPTDEVVHAFLNPLPSGSRVLDYGCGSGRMLAPHADRLEAYGVEVREPAAKAAEAQGIRIVRDADVLAGKCGRFSAILLADVYEHLTRPFDVARSLASQLAPDGMLIIVTGNADAVPTRSRLGEFWYLRYECHLHMASRKHMEWLAQGLSLELEALRERSHYSQSATVMAKQWLQSFAYDKFKDSPDGLTATLLRRVPVVRKAEQWPLAPAVTYREDHLVAILRKHP